MRGGLNTYAYVDGKPLRRTDSEGLLLDKVLFVAAALATVWGGYELYSFIDERYQRSYDPKPWDDFTKNPSAENAGKVVGQQNQRVQDAAEIHRRLAEEIYSPDKIGDRMPQPVRIPELPGGPGAGKGNPPRHPIFPSKNPNGEFNDPDYNRRCPGGCCR